MNTDGFTIYFIFKHYLGFSFETGSHSARISLGWIAICFAQVDIEEAMTCAIEEIKKLKTNKIKSMYKKIKK